MKILIDNSTKYYIRLAFQISKVGIYTNISILVHLLYILLQFIKK